MRTSRMRRCVFVSVVLLGLSACGDDGPSMTPVPPPAPPPDAGGLGPVPPPTAEVPEPSAPAPPVIPWLEAGRPDVAAPAPPELGPCPEGWRRIESATGIAHCDPWPEAGHARCARDDETMLPGDPACRRIGSACPAGDFATDFPAGSTVVHVRPSAEPDGDGTPERPFATIEAAIAGSPQRAILALAKGTYREAVRLNGGRVLWGACVAETVLSVTDASAAGDGVVTVTGRNVGVRNLQIADSGRVGINLRGTGASGAIEDVLVARTAIAGVLASDGASFTMSRSLVREVGLGTATTGDRGVHLQAGATGELSSVVIDGTVGRGISVASDGTILRATDVAVVRTAKPPRSYADAVLAALGGTIELSRVVVDDLDTNAIRAEGAGSRVTATDVLVRGAGASDRSEMDSAVTALMAGQVSLERAAVVGFGEIGVTAFGEGSTVSLADVLVSGRGDEGAVVGTGLYVGFVGSMSASRVAVENVRDFAVGVDEPGSRFDGTDVIVRDVARVDGAMGTVGVQLTNGAAAVLTRVSIGRAAEEAAVSHGAGTTLELRDLRVAETDARLSSALRIEELGTMTVERAVLEEVRYVGVSVAHGATLRASDVVVRRCLQPPDGLSGAGFEVSYGGIAELVRVLVSECLDAGIVAAIEGSSLTMTDVVVRDTTESTTTVAAGFGLLVMRDATARAERLAVERATQSAVTVAERARAELFDVSVRDTRASDVDGYGGWSLAAQMGGEIVAERIEASGARQASLVTYGGTLSLRDLRVTQTASADCERWSCPSGSHGYGVVALAQGRASLDRFVIDESSLCGSMVASVDVASLFTGPGEIDLTDGTISNAPVGACVQVDGYALERLSRNVLYLDNGVNLDATSYPPPAPAALPTL